MNAQKSDPLPDTGISGLYEVIYATDDIDYTLSYFSEFGFSPVDSASFTKDKAEALYGYASGFKSYRLQNGEIDSHGLLRVIKWDEPKKEQVGYTEPRTIGQRFAVMKTEDIFRLNDIYNHARTNGEIWLATPPIADDLFDLNGGKKDFFQRPVIVRENAVYGAFFNHIFFQRYGYHIEGYGTVNKNTPLKTSEFTHHDFFIKCKDMSEMAYLSSALGLKAEDEPSLDGEWKKGPKEVFQMKPGEAHWYQGFVSPNNICGKLKFFIPTSPTMDKSEGQVIGALGITLHSFYTDKIAYVHELVTSHQLSPSSIQKNEFGELCFIFAGPGGCSWQIIHKSGVKNIPVKNLEFTLTKN